MKTITNSTSSGHLPSFEYFTEHCIPAGWDPCTQWLVDLCYFITFQNKWKSCSDVHLLTTFCFEFVVFLLPSLFGLLDELGDCELSDPNCPLILGSDTELLRELTKEKLCTWAFNIFVHVYWWATAYWWVISSKVIYWTQETVF